MSRVNVPKFGAQSVYLKGIATNLKPGDALLLVGKEREQQDAGSERWDFRRIANVAVDTAGNRTRIEWDEGLGTTSPHKVLPAAEPKFYALRQRASLFGANAPHPATLSDQTLAHYGQLPSSDWTFSISGQSIDLDNTYPAILRGSWLVLSKPTLSGTLSRQQVTEGRAREFHLWPEKPRASASIPMKIWIYSTAQTIATRWFLRRANIWKWPKNRSPIRSPARRLNWRRPAGLLKGQMLAASGKDSVSGRAISEVVTISDISGGDAYGHAGARQKLRARIVFAQRQRGGGDPRRERRRTARRRRRQRRSSKAFRCASRR